MPELMDGTTHKEIGLGVHLVGRPYKIHDNVKRVFRFFHQDRVRRVSHRQQLLKKPEKIIH
jgi:hypothetical protein